MVEKSNLILTHNPCINLQGFLIFNFKAMTSREFTYWLQGFFELSNAKQLSQEQVACIKAHLNLVFVHEIDPSYGDVQYQKELSDIHEQGVIVTDDRIKTEEDCIKKYGQKPSVNHEWSYYGWYDKRKGKPKC